MLGSEEIAFEKGIFKYKKSFGGFGKVKEVDLSNVQNIELIKYSDKSFKKSMESYFWNMGAETIGLKTSRKYFLVGMQLEQKDAKLLFDLLKAGVKNY